MRQLQTCLVMILSLGEHSWDLVQCVFISLFGARIAQLVVCWVYCHAWCSVMVSRDFPLQVNMSSDSIPSNSFRWEYKRRSSLSRHAFHRMDSKDPDIHVLDRWMPATKRHRACTIHKDGMWLPLWKRCPCLLPWWLLHNIKCETHLIHGGQALCLSRTTVFC